MTWLLVLPILIPLASAGILLAFKKHNKWQRRFSILTSFAVLLSSIALLNHVTQNGILVAQMGDWQAPFGISLVGDQLSAIMVLITGIMGFTVSIYATQNIPEELESLGYHPLYQVLLAGISGAFLTGDLFNLYVWFEVLLISSFTLLTLGGSKAQLKGGVHYVLINLFSSLLFLTAIGILYGLTGALNMADIAVQLSDLPAGLVTTIAMLFLVAFGIKAAIFPLFFWLPSSYHTPPVAISAIFAAMLSKVGLYALIRAFTLLFTQDLAYTHSLLLWLAMLTMLIGVLGAVAQTDIRKLLNFHIVSQIGYILLGLALFTPLGLTATVFYLVHNILAKTNLILLSGIIEKEGGSFELSELGGLYQDKPVLAITFALSAFSLAGIPPLSGFWAKLLVIRAGLEAEAYLAVAVSLIVSVLTLFSMTKIWQAAFWKPSPHEKAVKKKTKKGKAANLTPLYASTIGLAILIMLIGLWPQVLYTSSQLAASQLLDSQGYISSVLGQILGQTQ